ncbi:MAG: hypothetical protein ACREN8_00450 [Candidatus Dormibacteraceae bacterium]
MNEKQIQQMEELLRNPPASWDELVATGELKRAKRPKKARTRPQPVELEDKTVVAFMLQNR